MVPVHYLRAESIVEAEKSLLSDTELHCTWKSWFESLPMEQSCSQSVSLQLREEFTVKLLNAYCGCIMKIHKSRFSNTRNNGSVNLLLREQLKSVCANTSLTNKATTGSVTKNAYVPVLLLEAQRPISAAAKSTKKRKASLLVQPLGAEAVASAAGEESTEARSSNRFLSDFDSHRAAYSILQSISISSCFGSSKEADFAQELNLEKQIFGEDDSNWKQSTTTAQFSDDCCTADDEEESRNFDANNYYNT